MISMGVSRASGEKARGRFFRRVSLPADLGRPQALIEPGMRMSIGGQSGEFAENTFPRRKIRRRPRL